MQTIDEHEARLATARLQAHTARVDGAMKECRRAYEEQQIPLELARVGVLMNLGMVMFDDMDEFGTWLVGMGSSMLPKPEEDEAVH